jgi:hypothetical protein
MARSDRTKVWVTLTKLNTSPVRTALSVTTPAMILSPRRTDTFAFLLTSAAETCSY